MSTRHSSMRAASKVKNPDKPVWREYADALLVAVVLTFIIRSFIIQAFRIPSGSMEDTLLVGDFLFVNKFLYGAQVPFTKVRLPAIRAPQPGDIIVFKFPRDPKKDYIKRCVAVEGQTVEVRDKQLLVDGQVVDESFIKHVDPRTLAGDIEPRDNLGPVRVPEGKLFMMGDNRDSSFDSRFWGFLDRDLVKGKAIFIYWSWDPAKKILGFINTPRLARIGDLVR